uniref:Spore coat protein n=1 Tax=Steinernema glaseri TaxID=37863 RepID=A0A1I7YBQ9_9BILA
MTAMSNYAPYVPTYTPYVPNHQPIPNSQVAHSYDPYPPHSQANYYCQPPPVQAPMDMNFGVCSNCYTTNAPHWIYHDSYVLCP